VERRSHGVTVIEGMPPNQSLEPTAPIGARKQRRSGFAGGVVQEYALAKSARRVSSQP
jgi:hypothetical protein